LARVVLRDELRQLCGLDAQEVSIEADNLRQLIKALDARFPGAEALLTRDGTAVAIDGLIYNHPLVEPLKPDSEVVFIPAIRGG